MLSPEASTEEVVKVQEKKENIVQFADGDTGMSKPNFEVQRKEDLQSSCTGSDEVLNIQGKDLKLIKKKKREAKERRKAEKALK